MRAMSMAARWGAMGDVAMEILHGAAHGAMHDAIHIALRDTAHDATADAINNAIDAPPANRMPSQIS